MAGPFYVDDGGDGTTESSWATADTSINALDTEYVLASDEIVYFGHDHICQAANVASLVITGPASGRPTLFISATTGSSPPTYQASTSPQIDTSEGAYNLVFDGSFALYGMSLKSGGTLRFDGDHDESSYAFETRFALGANGYLDSSVTTGDKYIKDCVVDLTADGTSARTSPVAYIYGSTEIYGLTFVNAGYRTGAIFNLATGLKYLSLSGADMSGFTNATTCEIFDATSMDGYAFANNCITKSSPVFFTAGRPRVTGSVLITNCGPENSPTALVYRDYFGDVISTTAITRTGGGSVEGTGCSLLVTTEAVTGEGSPFKTPWQHEKVTSTGSKTFDVYITNDTADFTDAEVWLEVEYLSTATEAIFAIADDSRATITTTAAAQTDDVTSTWSGTGPGFTYKQKLSVTATIGVAGLYRWRVCVGVASIASSRYFYIDPKVTVS